MSEKKKVIFFDGQCALCHRSVRFVFKRDNRKEFYFAPLFGQYYETFTIIYDPAVSVDSVLYFDGTQFYKKSNAVLKVFNDLGGMWKIFMVFKIIPSPWRDRLYDFVAHHRFQWFGRCNECELQHDLAASQLLE